MENVNHIAIIIDGNRRWAKEHGLKPWQGHEEGAKKVENFIDDCISEEIKEITIYALSTENLKRDKIELEFLFKLFKEWFKKMKKDDRIEKNKIKIKFIGDLSLVPKDISDLAHEMEKDTEKNNRFTINFCFAYGGRLELLHAFNKLKNKEKITEEDVTNSLWLKSSPDLIIRTGGDIRLSNFLPWQSVYSEWLFLKKLWPDYNKQDLLDALDNYKNRKRNFGK